MASLAQINIRFTADLAQFSSQMENVNRDIKKLGTSLSSVGNTLSVGLTLPILAFGAAALTVYADIESLQKGLTSVMGSSAAAADEFERLKEVAKLPGLGLEEAVRGSVNMQAAGFSADFARKSLLAFGNALATVGKGKNELNLVTLALTQLQNKSGGYAQDLRQLTEQLPQLRGALTAAFGTADSETISKSGKTGKQVVEALVKEFEKLPKVTGGIKNAFENTSDAVKLSLAKVGESINKTFDVEGKLNGLSESLAGLADGFSQLSPTAQATILTIAGVAAAIGPLLVAIGGLITLGPLLTAGVAAVSSAFVALGSSFLPIVAAVGLAVFVFKDFFTEIKKASDGVTVLSENQNTLNVTLAKGNENAVKEVGALDKLYVSATNVKNSVKDRKLAVDELQKLFPAYFSNITDENILNGKSVGIYKELREAIFDKSRAVALDGELQKRANERVEKELQISNEIAKTEAELIRLRSRKGDVVIKGSAQEKEADVIIKTSDLIIAQTKLLAIQKKQRDDYFANALKQDEDIFNAKAFYLSKTKKLQENEGAKNTSSSTIITPEEKAKKTEKIYDDGTIGFFEAQIKSLQELQKEIPKTNASWQLYENQINSVKTKIDGLSTNLEVIPKLTPVKIDAEKTQADFDAEIAKLEDFKKNIATNITQVNEANAQIKAIELDKMIKFDPTGLINVTEQIKNFGVGFNSETEKIKQNAIDFSAQLTSIVQDSLGNFAVGLSEMIGKLAAGSGGIADINTVIFKQIAGLMKSLGEAAIKIGVTMAAIKLSFSNPLTAIATGVALVAFSSIIESQLPKFEKGGIVGGSSFYGDKILARVNSGELILNGRQQDNLYKQLNPALNAQDVVNPTVSGEFVLKGENLVVALARANRAQNSIK